MTNDGIEPEAAVATKVVDRIPRAGEDAALEQAIRDLIAAALQFPGHLGVTVTRPSPPAQPGFRIVYRFDTAEHLHAWEASAAYAELAAIADRHTQGPAASQDLTGLEAWITLPGAPAPPRRWRMAVVSWFGIYPLVAAIGWALGLLLPTQTPWLVRSALVSGAAVALMTYVVGPRLTRLFRRWLDRG